MVKKTGANANSGNFTRINIEGQEYLIPFLDRPWDIKDVSVEDIKRYSEDFFVQNIFLKLTNFIFIGKPTFNVVQGDKSREDIAIWMRELIKKVGFVNFLKFIWYDVCIWGNSFHSDGVDRILNQWEYTEFRLLPPELFSEYSNDALEKTRNREYTFGRLLKGVEKHPDGTIHFWQKTDTYPVEVHNIKLVKSPIRSYFLDGIPLFNPLYKILPKVYFSLDQLMMTNNRSNILFLGVDDTGKQTLPDNKTSKWEYSKNVLKSASNKSWFPLPGGVELMELKGQTSDIPLKTIDLLSTWLISYISPTDILSKGDGAVIGGNSNYEAQLFKIFSETLQDYIAGEAEKILDQMLIWNGWLDCHTEVKIPRLTFDDAKLDLEIAKFVLDAQKSGWTIASINEVRNKVEWEDASIEYLLESQKEWEKVKKEPPQPQLMNGGFNSQNKSPVSKPKEPKKNATGK